MSKIHGNDIKKKKKEEEEENTAIKEIPKGLKVTPWKFDALKTSMSTL